MSQSLGESSDESNNLIKDIVQDLLSYDSVRQKRVFEYYFFRDASLSSPLMSTEGVANIQNVYTVWKSLNREEPTITNIVFDGKTAVVHLTQNLCPSIFPFVRMKVPAMVTLHFKETEADSGLLKIYREEDSWTLEGLISSVPLISYWYDNVVRVIMGKLFITAGDVIHSAVIQAQKMSLHGKEIQRLGQQLAQEKLDEYRAAFGPGSRLAIEGPNNLAASHNDMSTIPKPPGTN